MSEWLSSKNPQTTNSREDVERRELSCTVGGNVNWYTYYGEQYGGSLKKLKIEIPYDPAIVYPSPGNIPKGKHGLKGYMHPNDHCSTIYNSQDVEATEMSIDR